MSLLEINDNFTVSDDLNGPAIAVILGIELVLALSANAFVLILTLCNHKVLQQPSVIFLTNLIIYNLIFSSLYMTPEMVAAAAGEWVFGNTVEQKHASCQFVGFVSANILYLTLFSLGVLSVDRFLFIVKPMMYKRIMKTWLAWLICACCWVFSIILSTTPFYGLGQYGFHMYAVNCVTVWPGHTDFVLFCAVILLAFIVLITVTTIWTYCFTRKYLSRMEALAASVGNDHQTHYYSIQHRKAIGVFTVILFVTGIAYLPGILAALVGAVIGQGNIPGPIHISIHIIFYINYIINPIVQSYFRREIKEFIVQHCCLCRTNSDGKSSGTATKGGTTSSAEIV